MAEIRDNLVDADLGCGLFKKRIAKVGRGKRSGYRSLLAFQAEDRLLFMFGFSKNDRENIDTQEKALYKQLAKYYLRVPISMLEVMCEKDELFEVIYEKK